MRNRRLVSETRIGWALPLGFALLILTASGLFAQERESPPSRSLPVETRAPSPPPAPTSPPPAAPSNPGGAGPSSSPGRGGGGRHHYGGRYGYHHFRPGFWGYGYLWPYSRFYWNYGWPYYPWGMVWYPAYSSDTRLGALDLGVKPRKVEVWVDGQFVGTAGKLDGYPGYLWLTEGSHRLVFYREGWETVERRVSVRSGPVRKLNLELAEGPSTKPEDLFERGPRIAGKANDDERPPSPSRNRRESSAEMDLRGEPGRFRLEVAPLDASVYLDGRFVGTAEELSRLHSGMMVDPGNHVIDVQRPGYETERVTFSVESGEETDVRIDLGSSEAPND